MIFKIWSVPALAYFSNSYLLQGANIFKTKQRICWSLRISRLYPGEGNGHLVFSNSWYVDLGKKQALPQKANIFEKFFEGHTVQKSWIFRNIFKGPLNWQTLWTFTKYIWKDLLTKYWVFLEVPQFIILASFWRIVWGSCRSTIGVLKIIWMDILTKSGGSSKYF